MTMKNRVVKVAKASKNRMIGMQQKARARKAKLMMPLRMAIGVKES